MRLKTLLVHHFTTTKKAIIIFILCYSLGTFAGTLISNIFNNNVTLIGISSTSTDGTVISFSSFAFAIFLFVCYLVSAQSDTRLLATRSASRKEIFVSNAIFLLPLSAIMAVLQIATIYADGFIRYLFTGHFNGLKMDAITTLAPNSNNIFMFFAVSTAILFLFGSIGYLIGTLIAKQKMITLGALVIIALILISLLSVDGVLPKIIDFFLFMFTDKNTGLMIALKQIGLGVILLPIVYFIARKLPVVK